MKRSAIKWTSRAAIAAGASLLLYTLFILAWAGGFQAYQQWSFERHLAGRETTSSPGAVTSSAKASPRLDSVIGRMEIPRLHLSTMVIEGDGDQQLLLAAGHVPGTALPGQVGNLVIAAHRDTFFRPLRKISQNDEIVITTEAGTYRYLVDSIAVTDPNNVSVLDASAQPSLTLITCYPFYFVGSAPERFVVHARELE